MAQQKPKPVHEIRLGRVRAAIWANRHEEGRTRLSFTLSRLYRSGDEWRDSNSFYRDDAPLVAKVADMALAWVLDHEASAAALDE